MTDSTPPGGAFRRRLSGGGRRNPGADEPRALPSKADTGVGAVENIVLGGLAELRSHLQTQEQELRANVMKGPETDQKVLRDMHDLAVLLSRRGGDMDVAEAEGFFRTCYTHQANLLGENHPTAKRTLANLELLRAGGDRESYRPSNVSMPSFQSGYGDSVRTSGFRSSFDDDNCRVSANECRLSFEGRLASPRRGRGQGPDSAIPEDDVCGSLYMPETSRGVAP